MPTLWSEVWSRNRKWISTPTLGRCWKRKYHHSILLGNEDWRNCSKLFIFGSFHKRDLPKIGLKDHVLTLNSCLAFLKFLFSFGRNPQKQVNCVGLSPASNYLSNTPFSSGFDRKTAKRLLSSTTKYGSNNVDKRYRHNTTSTNIRSKWWAFKLWCLIVLLEKCILTIFLQ